MYFSYGIWDIKKDLFKEPYISQEDHNKFKNKISGGLWAGTYNDHYSDWVITTMIFPFLYGDNKSAKGTIFELKDANILELNCDNYNLFLKDGLIDFEKVRTYDAVLYTNELCSNIKEFESYYVESLQVFNFDVINVKEVVNLSIGVIHSPETLKFGRELGTKLIERVRKSDMFNELKRTSTN